MAETVRIRLARTLDAASLREELRRQGLTAELTRDTCALRVRGRRGDRGRLGRRVADAVDRWLSETSLPLVPLRVGDRDWIIRPPAS
jgi:hypothetical protein